MPPRRRPQPGRVENPATGIINNYVNGRSYNNFLSDLEFLNERQHELMVRFLQLYPGVHDQLDISSSAEQEFIMNELWNQFRVNQEIDLLSIATTARNSFRSENEPERRIRRRIDFDSAGVRQLPARTPEFIESSLARINESDDCSICLNSLSNNPVCMMYCGHVFHCHCVRQWGRGCPLCRDNVTVVIDDNVQLRPGFGNSEINYLKKITGNG